MIKFAVIVLTAITLAGLGIAKMNSLQEGTVTKLGEANPIQEGVLTDKQAKHSRIYKNFGKATGGKKLKDLVMEKGAVEVEVGMSDILLPDSYDLSKHLGDFTCKADLVVLGEVQSKTSQLIEEGTFLFTDYEVKVEEVLKNTASPLQIGQSITIVMPGGAAKIDGHIVQALDRRMGLLKVGDNYLVYLAFQPETGAFYPLYDSRFESVFHLKNNKVTQVSEKNYPFGERGSGSRETFLAEARTALSNRCEKGATQQ